MQRKNLTADFFTTRPDATRPTQTTQPAVNTMVEPITTVKTSVSLIIPNSSGRRGGRPDIKKIRDVSN